MKIPTRKKSKGKAKVKNLCRLESGTVKCWMDKKTNSICFRKKSSRRVNSVPLIDIYETATGQLKMLFV